jgi:hypothetical protein
MPMAAFPEGGSLFEHDLFGKPIHTFPDHALADHNPAGAAENLKFWRHTRQKLG